MTLTDRLRELVRAEMKACPTCGHSDRPLREMAKQLGVGHATLCRFLSGRAASEGVINRLYERYLVKLCDTDVEAREHFLAQTLPVQS